MRWVHALEGSADIYVGPHDYLSMTNSPYPPHIVGYAVDIYTPQAYMPAEKGVVRRVIEFPAPRNRPDSPPSDYLINIDIGAGKVLKILHVEPGVRVGDLLMLGDYIGEIIVSGFLRPWSDPHMHVEVRREGDEVRALGSLRLTPTEELLRLIGRECVHSLKLRLASRSGTFGVAEADGQICVRVGDAEAALDAGIPHYGIGGALCLEECSIGLASVGSAAIGEVSLLKDNGVALVKALTAFTARNTLLGIGTYLMSRKVKLVSLRGTPINEQGVIELHPVPYKGTKLPRWLRSVDDLVRYINKQ